MPSRTSRRATAAPQAATPPHTPATTSPSARYHHGDLRAALIDAARSQLAEDGIEAFSLRACARRAGVSHAAPAHHFGDARGLLTACAADGFVRLAGRMRAAMAAAEDTPLARLRAQGEAYIAFAIAEGALFQLMFRRERLDPTDPALIAAGRETGDLLRNAVGAATEALSPVGAKPVDEATASARNLYVWSVAHGYVTLLLEQQLSGLYELTAAQPEAARALGARLVAMIEAGLRSA